MTKVLLLSDLHLEFGKMKYKTLPECDVVVLAGDISPGVRGLCWARDTFKDKPIGYVAGNHEWYGKRNLFKHYDKMHQKAKELGVNFLQNETVVINGVRFVGATLWTDFSLTGSQPLRMLAARSKMNDYVQIYQAPRETLTPDTVLNEHNKSMEYLTKQLSEHFDGPTVVVTHHAPSEWSVGQRYRGDVANSYYASNLEQFIETMKPSVWCHGHMHSSSDYMVGDTRVLANPRGYVGQLSGYNNTFDPNFVFEI